MVSIRQMKTLQKFASVHANIHNHFSVGCHLSDRQTYKERRSASGMWWKPSLARASIRLVFPDPGPPVMT